MSVFLLCCVGRHPIEFLEREAEFPRVEFRPVRSLEISDKLLKLVEHVIVY